MEKIKLVMTRNKDDEKDLFDMLGTKEDRKEFDRQFNKNPFKFKVSYVCGCVVVFFCLVVVEFILH